MYSRRRIVMPKHMKLGVLDTTAGHMCKKGKEVSWSVFRLFADETRWVSTSGTVTMRLITMSLCCKNDAQSRCKLT